MHDTSDYISRFMTILIGYCLAVLASGFSLAIIILILSGSISFLHDLRALIADPQTAGFWSAIWRGGTMMSTFAGAFSFIPALILIIFAEACKKRPPQFYGLSGVVIATAAAGTAMLFTSGLSIIAALFLFASYAFAGLIAGFVYWLIAGRNAGRLANRPAQ
ncbi:hypothetical protein AAIB41_10355 [Brucella sp. BE17]|uniref:hypothetical protein n=1 Tax=Brucella sp. BE17 TaxID=3142977 RepID=UPI0031B9E9DC